MEPNTLAHYGIKGMKWGVRRTPAQLGHTKKSKRPSLFGKKNTTKKTVKSKTTSEPAKKKISDLTDEELQKKIDRLNLEKKYRELLSSTMPANTPKNSKAMKIAEDIVTNSIKNIGTQTVTYVAGKAANKILSRIFDDDHPINEKKGQKDK